MNTTSLIIVSEEIHLYTLICVLPTLLTDVQHCSRCVVIFSWHAGTYILQIGALLLNMELVRGKDQRAGQNGSLEQDALVAELRAAGLDEDKIDFWCSHHLTLQTVLGLWYNRCRSKGPGLGVFKFLLSL